MSDEATDTVNPVVARTRQAREALAKQCDYDLGKMLEYLNPSKTVPGPVISM